MAGEEEDKIAENRNLKYRAANKDRLAQYKLANTTLKTELRSQRTCGHTIRRKQSRKSATHKEPSRRKTSCGESEWCTDTAR